MTMLDGLLILLFIICSYFSILLILKRKGVLEKYNISLHGPILMIRTKRGLKLIEKIAEKKRFWKAFGSFGIVFCFIVMVLLVITLIMQLSLLFTITPEQKELLPTPDMALILPGLNPLLPVEYLFFIIIAMIVAIIVHEFSHAFLTIIGKVKVKSLGLLMIIIPLGAFCEPDEEGLKKIKRSKRMRVYAAGPMSNFVVAFIVLSLFSFVFMSAVQPVEGIEVSTVGSDTPAEEFGFTKGMVITSINNTTINTYDDFYYSLNNTESNQTVEISYFYKEKYYTKYVKLIDKYDVYYQNYIDAYDYIPNSTKQNISIFKGKGYLGVGPNPYDRVYYVNSLKNPYTYDFPDGFLNVYVLPFLGFYTGYNPLNAPFTHSFEITGPLGFLPTDVFWFIVNALYWIFWLNILVGMFNVLPIVPFDGGFLYLDAINSLIKRIKKDITDEKRESIAKNIALVTSLTILFLVIIPFFFRYI